MLAIGDLVRISTGEENKYEWPLCVIIDLPKEGDALAVRCDWPFNHGGRYGQPTEFYLDPIKYKEALDGNFEDRDLTVVDSDTYFTIVKYSFEFEIGQAWAEADRKWTVGSRWRDHLYKQYDSIREGTKRSLKERKFSTMTVVKRAFPQINPDAAKIIARWYNTEGFDPSEWDTLQEAVTYMYGDILEMLDAADPGEDKEIVVDGLIDCGHLDAEDRDIYIPVEPTLAFKVYLLDPDRNPIESVKDVNEKDCIYTIYSKDTVTPGKACTRACDLSIKYGNKHPSKRAVIVEVLPDGDIEELNNQDAIYMYKNHYEDGTVIFLDSTID